MKSPSYSTRSRPIRTGPAQYRTAADTILAMERPVHEIVAFDGSQALTELPGIGASLARSLEQLTKTGRLPLLEQLRGVYGPEEKIATVPGIGPKTAARIHQSLGISTLAELQAAAYDGRLAKFPEWGPSGYGPSASHLPAASADRPALSAQMPRKFMHRFPSMSS